MTIEDMRYELAEYYENTGFADVYSRVIKHKIDEEILIMYKEIHDGKEIQLDE